MNMDLPCNVYICNVDVIGHVAEKDVIKETEKNGKKIKVMDITLEDLEWDKPFWLDSYYNRSSY